MFTKWVKPMVEIKVQLNKLVEMRKKCEKCKKIMNATVKNGKR